MGDRDQTGKNADPSAGDDGGLFQSRDDGQLHFAPATAATTFPVTAPENATPLEEDETEGVIPPSPLWAMKERRHEQWFHLGHPERIRACVGTGDAAVYAIDDGSHHCMIGRRVGATARRLRVLPDRQGGQEHLPVPGLGSHRRQAGLPGRPRGRAERDGRSARRLQHLRRRLLPAPRRDPRRVPAARPVHRVRPRTCPPPTADHGQPVPPPPSALPALPVADQAKAEPISSRAFGRRRGKGRDVGAGTEDRRDALASTDPAGHPAKRAAHLGRPCPLGPHPGRQDDPTQFRRAGTRTVRGWPRPPPPPFPAGTAPPRVELGDLRQQHVLHRSARFHRRSAPPGGTGPRGWSSAPPR